MPKPTHDDWVKTVLFDRGYLPRIRGEAIKVYLAIIEACGGVPDRSVTISLSLLMRRTQLSCPTVIDSLSRLGGPRPGRFNDPPARQGEDLLRLRPTLLPDDSASANDSDSGRSSSNSLDSALSEICSS